MTVQMCLNNGIISPNMPATGGTASGEGLPAIQAS